MLQVSYKEKNKAKRGQRETSIIHVTVVFILVLIQLIFPLKLTFFKLSSRYSFFSTKLLYNKISEEYEK